MRHGEFDPPSMVPYRNESKYGLAAYPHERYSAVSLEGARQSITLLKNHEGTLPLRVARDRRVAMFGCLIHTRRTGGLVYSDCHVAATAGYDSASQSGPLKTTPTPDAALRALGYNATFVNASFTEISGGYVLSAQGAQTVAAAAAAADINVVFVGRAGKEGESGSWCQVRTCGDNSDLQLPSEQRELLSHVLGSGKPVVLVLFNTNPLDLASVMDGAAAIVHAFYPQQWAGTAVADILSGRSVPAGRMPYSWVRNLNDTGSISNYTMTGTSKTYRYQLPHKEPPLFPFGFGLSYSKFEYSSLSIHPSAPSTCDNITVTATVTNVGDVDADEVVQVFATFDKGAPLPSPYRQLVAFERLHTRAGTSQNVELSIPPARLALVDDTKAVGGNLPVRMVVPLAMQLSLGGQQPEQATTAPSNVLSTPLVIHGASVPLDTCGRRVPIISGPALMDASPSSHATSYSILG